MKTKKRAKIHRNRLEGKIKAEAVQDVEAALRLAMYGSNRTALQEKIRSYLERAKKIRSWRTQPSEPERLSLFSGLCTLFVDAFCSGDVCKLRLIASEVETFNLAHPIL